MIKGISLLDKMGRENGSPYLSDLHYLDDSGRMHLASVLKEIPANEASITDWNAAIKYCTDISNEFTNPGAAKAALISALSTPVSKE
ncbi:MAG: hypothetical protein Q4C14_03465 [Bacillota bacterium]|nr:hypothetical protein [Bacillota bacterium]